MEQKGDQFFWYNMYTVPNRGAEFGFAPVKHGYSTAVSHCSQTCIAHVDV